MLWCFTYSLIYNCIFIDICHQVLDLYSSSDKNAPPSPPTQDKFVVPKKVVPPQSIYQKLILQKMAAKYSEFSFVILIVLWQKGFYWNK